ncbi:MAG: transcriptional regulator [Chitinophagales bacterium]|nr:MAG: transcriptional regulator [Chitinophagales bacterium]
MSYLNKTQNDLLRNMKMKIRALNHPLRQKMLVLIKKHKNRMNVTDIYVRLRIEQSVASQHLAILRHAGLVSTKREGKTIWYSVNEEAIQKLLKVCEQAQST